MSENKNIPDWLKNAKKAIEEFDNSEYGKLNDKEFRKKRAAQENGSLGALSQIKSGTHNWQNSSGKRHEMPPMSEEHKFKFSSAGGKAQKGIPRPCSKIEAKKLDIAWTCKHCNKSGRGTGNFKRYGHHDGTCSQKKLRKSTLIKYQKIQDTLPETFTVKEAFSYCKKIKVSQGMMLTWIKEYAIKIHEGTNGSPIDVPIFKKKGDQ